jgi:Putative ATPase subunit of terminase (gpP-like)
MSQYEPLIRHAQLFGIDCVELAAEQIGYSPLDKVKFKLELQKVATEHKRTKKPKVWWEDAPKVGKEDTLLLYEAGYTVEEIAEAVGQKVSSVRKWRYASPEQAAQAATATEKTGDRE